MPVTHHEAQQPDDHAAAVPMTSELGVQLVALLDAHPRKLHDDPKKQSLACETTIEPAPIATATSGPARRGVETQHGHSGPTIRPW